MIEVQGGSRAAAPKGLITYAFTHEEISLSPSPSSGWDLGLRARIWGLEAEMWASDLDFALVAKTQPLRLGFWP